MSQISLFFWFSSRLSTSISICAVEKVGNAFFSLEATVLCLGGSRDGGSDELWPRHFFLICVIFAPAALWPTPLGTSSLYVVDDNISLQRFLGFWRLGMLFFYG